MPTETIDADKMPTDGQTERWFSIVVIIRAMSIRTVNVFHDCEAREEVVDTLARKK